MNSYTIFDARLVADPERIETKDGKGFVKARVADNPPGKKDDKRPARFVTLKGFGQQADQLQRLSKNDVITVEGQLALEAFTNKKGEAQTADVVIVTKFRVQKSDSFFEAGDKPAAKQEQSLDDLFGAP